MTNSTTPAMNDPLVPLQWHLSMIGQLGFGAGSTAFIGLDRVWADHRGQGVHVGQWDIGVQYSHWDLATNYDPSRHLVIEGALNDGLPLFVGYDEHGTAVAGLIAAARNGLGGVGVAYEAGLTSVRVLGGADDLSTQFPRYLLTLNHLSDFDVTNHSYGTTPNFIVDQDQAKYEVAAAIGRNGLGTVVVYASGNDNADANGEQIGAVRFTVTAGAVGPDGQVATYANYGANLLVTAPASSVTTDLLGDGAGRDGLADGDYTDNFGGTSGSTPVVTGVVALMLSANAGLGWRDVQNILALSATGTGSLYGGPSANENAGWAWNGDSHWNGGGRHFSADYGFGVVNAFNAVRMSEAWALIDAPALVSDNEHAVDTGLVSVAQPIADDATSEWRFTITAGLALEHVSLDLRLTHASLPDTVIRLVSPQGTVMTVYDGSTGTSDQADAGFAYTFGIAGLRGESAVGEWRLQIQDRVAGNEGVLDSYRFTGFGTLPMADDLYHYTDEVGVVLQQAGQAGRAVLADGDGGTDWLAAAAMWRDLVIDLSPGGTSTVGGIAFATLATGTVLEHAVAGDGNDHLTGNSGANRLYGMRGDDTLAGGGGDDLLLGGPGDDLLDGGDGVDTASYVGATAGVAVNLGSSGPQPTGGAGVDTLISIENLIGSDHDDVLVGNAGANRLEGGAGGDLLNGAAGADTMLGGGGSDIYGVDDIGDLVIEADPDRSSGGDDWLYAFVDASLPLHVENLRILTAVAAQATGNALDNRIVAGDGDNRIDGAAGADTVSYEDARAAVVASLALGSAQTTGGSGSDTLISIEHLVGSAYADHLTGNAEANMLDGGAGIDTLVGGDGSDTYVVDHADDTVIERNADATTGGIDRVITSVDFTLGAHVEQLRLLGGTLAGIGNGLDNLLVAGAGDNLLDGGGGNDTVSYEDATSAVAVGLVASAQATGGSGVDTLVSIENLSGSAHNDQLAGDAVANHLWGLAGDDLLFGGDGADTLWGGDGSDLMFGDAGDDHLDGAAGNDVAYGGIGDDQLHGGDGSDVLVGDAGIDTLDGGSGADAVYGGAGDDLLDFDGQRAGGFARDSYDGGFGADTLSLLLGDAQLSSAATRADLDGFAGYIASHLNLGSDSGPVYSFSTLALDARNIEQLLVNGVVYTGARARVHIDPSAPEGGNGSLLKPFNAWSDVTWQANTDYLQKAGTVIRADVNVTVQATADTPVVIGSYGDEPTGGARDRPQILGAVTFDNASHVTLQGLDLHSAEFGAVTLLGGAHHITVRDNEIRDSQAGVLIRASAGGDNRIEGNIIHNNAGQGIAMAGGVAGHGDVVAYNSVIANGLHGIEISSSYATIEYNEVMSNGNLTVGTSGIHTHVDAYGDGSGHDLVIRLNIVSDSQENFGPDGNGIELDRWTYNVDVYSNVLYGNDGQGFVAFQSKDWRAFDNVIFDNMKSEAHNNYARPVEALILSYSLLPEDQTERFIFVNNVVASSGQFVGSSEVDVVAMMVDAPTIFWSRMIAGNTLYSGNGGDLYNWGFSPDEIWGPGEIGNSIARWNELKQNGDPDVLGDVQMQSLDGVAVDSRIEGSAKIDLMQGGTGNDYLVGADGADVLVGGAGDDVLDGGSGVDRLIGGRGNDIYIVDSADDRIWEFPDSGTDTVYTTFDYALPAYVENALMQGNAVAGLAGNELVNFLEGNEATNGIQGNGAADVLLGHGGNDHLIGGEGDDYIDGGAGDDLLQPGSGYDLLVGGLGDDVFVIHQGEGHDSVLDYEGWYALHGDLLEFHGFGPDAALNYTGSDGLWRIDFSREGVAQTEYVSLVGVTLLSAVDDYVFVDTAATGSMGGAEALPDVVLSAPDTALTL